MGKYMARLTGLSLFLWFQRGGANPFRTEIGAGYDGIPALAQ